uniref:Dynein light chain n=1 Tax=Proboscia inermis TaxID=420281 RepID=A0A7S0CLV0_9STRA|mmetsp:Transcript_8732/g.8857  ORF Transcript_8732/g.8857 Transcript_8732/m.8857 type:complete len:145 (+) Transcript_8732:37-471(+)
MLSDTARKQENQYIDIVEPTYITKPGEDEKFYPSQVMVIADAILKSELSGKVDEKWVGEWSEYSEDFESLSIDIADKIKEECKQKLEVERYKLMVQVTFGQMKNQGVRITSRCLWDTTTDNYATASYKNEHIWASAVVFGLYTE